MNQCNYIISQVSSAIDGDRQSAKCFIVAMSMCNMKFKCVDSNEHVQYELEFKWAKLS